MTMILGIVTELAIFYFSEPHDALHEAGEHHTLPILMSVVAAILTLLLPVLAIGQASQMQPLAIAIISGILL